MQEMDLLSHARSLVKWNYPMPLTSVYHTVVLPDSRSCVMPIGGFQGQEAKNNPLQFLLGAVDSFSDAPDLKMPNGDLINHSDADGLICGIKGTRPVNQAITFLREFPFSRNELDSYAVENHRRASQAWKTGIYHDTVLKLGSLERDEETIREDPNLEGLKKAPGLYGQNVLAVSNVVHQEMEPLLFVASNDKSHLFRHSPFVFELVDMAYSFCDPRILFPAALPAIQKLFDKQIEQDFHLL